MEINKIVKKIDDLHVSLYNAVNDDIDYLCNKLCQDLDIYKRGERNHLISQGELKHMMQLYLNLHIESKICQGITSQNSRCSRKAKHNSSYCQLHINKYRISHNLTIKHEQNIKHDIVFVNESNYDNNNGNSVGKTSMKTKFLNDKFYNIDGKFIYEKDTFDKVGYIKITENGKSEYILTDDPFILEEIMHCT